MRRNIVIGIVTAATLAVGGAAAAVTVAGDRDGDDRGQSASESPAVERGDGRAASDADTGALAKAVEAALAATGGAAVSAEVDDDADGADGADGADRAVWEVDVRTARGSWREVTVDTDRGRVLGTRSDDPDEGEASALRTARTSLREAAAAAARAVPGTVVSVEIDDDARSRPWEVKVLAQDGTRHEVFVDRRTAAVTDDGTGDRASGGGDRASGGGGNDDRTTGDDRGRRHGGHGEDDRHPEDAHDGHGGGSGHEGGEDD